MKLFKLNQYRNTSWVHVRYKHSFDWFGALIVETNIDNGLER